MSEQPLHSYPDHKPVQHRDGKPPWCKTCGLTADFQFPVSRFARKHALVVPCPNCGAPAGQACGNFSGRLVIHDDRVTAYAESTKPSDPS